MTRGIIVLFLGAGMVWMAADAIRAGRWVNRNGRVFTPQTHPWGFAVTVAFFGLWGVLAAVGGVLSLIGLLP